MRHWEEYLMILGERNIDYGYSTAELFAELGYFKKCYKDGLSVYKALEFFSWHLEDKKDE